ncbi:MAG: SAM-dependent methyltransferase [Nitritalea sp.]
MESKKCSQVLQGGWFKEWFNTPYYHLLYRNRDTREAQYFIDRLAAQLDFQPGQEAMDLACGKGRHSIYLAEKGLDVTGLDLSQENIRIANASAHARLRFYEHDMRRVFAEGRFDYVFNLFTSFGYFDADEDDYCVIQAIAQALKPGGRLVLDFLNPAFLLDNLQAHEEKVIDGVRFLLRRQVRDGFVVKDIAIQDGASRFAYMERVKLISKDRFEYYFSCCGLVVEELFGDYALNAYHPSWSERMLFIVRKPA